MASVSTLPSGVPRHLPNRIFLRIKDGNILRVSRAGQPGWTFPDSRTLHFVIEYEIESGSVVPYGHALILYIDLAS